MKSRQQTKQASPGNPQRRLLCAGLLALTATACGGGGSGSGNNGSGGPPPAGGGAAPTLTASASAPYTLAGGSDVTLSATVSDTSVVTWQLAAGSPGTLSTTTGASVRYQPPASGVATATTVTVNASAGGTTKAVTFVLHPDPGAARLEVIADSSGSASIDGSGMQARFNGIRHLALDPAGGLLVAEATGLRKIAHDGTTTTLYSTDRATSVAWSPTGLLTFAERDAGTGTVAILRLDGNRQPVTFATMALAPFDELRLYRTDNGTLYGVQNERIVTISETGTITPLVGSVTGVYQAVQVDGAADVARFRAIAAVTGDDDGNLYVADGPLIRKVSAAGTVSTLAGSDGPALPQDGTGSAARFLYPFGLALDGLGNLHVLDSLSGSAAVALRTVTPAGVVTSGKPLDNTVRTIVGNGGARMLVAGTARIDILAVDGSTTRLAGVEQNDFLPAFLMAADAAGNVYVEDRMSPGLHGSEQPGLTLRKVTPSGMVTPFVNSTAVNVPTGIVADRNGNFYVSDSQVSGWGFPLTGGGAIHKITPEGSVALLAGSTDQAVAQADGTGSAARFLVPTVIGLDTDDNLYVSDRISTTAAGTTVRRITPAGVVTTVAALPEGLGTVKDINGSAYTTDAAQSVVYRTTPAGARTVVAGTLNESGSYSGVLPGRLANPRALVATGPFSFALLSGAAVMRLVVPR